MTPERAGLIRAHWEALTPAGARLAEAFVERLFALDPQVRQRLGPVGGAALAEQFGTVAGGLVRRLEAPEDLIPELSRLGRRLQELGVSERNYDLLGDALLTALRTTAGAGWHAELQDAWLEAYTVAASIMKRAGQRVSGATAIVAG